MGLACSWALHCTALHCPHIIAIINVIVVVMSNNAGTTRQYHPRFLLAAPPATIAAAAVVGSSGAFSDNEGGVRAPPAPCQGSNKAATRQQQGSNGLATV